MNGTTKPVVVAVGVILAISGFPAGQGKLAKHSPVATPAKDVTFFSPTMAFAESLQSGLNAAPERLFAIILPRLNTQNLPLRIHDTGRLAPGKTSAAVTPVALIFKSSPNSSHDTESHGLDLSQEFIAPALRFAKLDLARPVKLDPPPQGPAWQGSRILAVEAASPRLDDPLTPVPSPPKGRGESNCEIRCTRPLGQEGGLEQVRGFIGSQPASRLLADVQQPALQAAGIAPGRDLSPGADGQSSPALSIAPQTPPEYTGKLISLDLRGVDIRDFFRLIHQVSGLNIVVDSDVAGQVTLVLDDVPWDQALDLVLKNNGLGRVLEGNVLRIARIQTLAAEADQTQQLRQAKLEAEPLITVVRGLHYASAEDQKPQLSTSGSATMPGMSGGGGGSMTGNLKPIPGVATILTSAKGVLSRRGSVVADPRDNAVVITDVPSQFPVINSFIDRLDTKSKQVSIQARVVLASSEFTRSLSSILSGSYGNRSGSTTSLGGTGTGIVGEPGAVGVPGSSSSGTSTLSPAQTAAGFGAFAITNAGARYILNAAISAAEENDQARTISRPTIVTQNNFPGEVMQGVQIPVETSINLTVTTQYVNAALVLTVTPQVTVDNKVFLDIDVSDDTPGTLSTTVGYSINVQEATAKVLVPDGGTVVFGGITVTTRSRSASYVPLIGNIPILGNLFKSSQVSDQDQELLFFVSPTVLPD